MNNEDRKAVKSNRNHEVHFGRMVPKKVVTVTPHWAEDPESVEFGTQLEEDNLANGDIVCEYNLISVRKVNLVREVKYETEK